MKILALLAAALALALPTQVPAQGFPTKAIRIVVSYPPGQRAISCYRSEPWHVRYLGRTRAAAIHASGLVPRAWLWIHVVRPPS